MRGNRKHTFATSPGRISTHDEHLTEESHLKIVLDTPGPYTAGTSVRGHVSVRSRDLTLFKSSQCKVALYGQSITCMLNEYPYGYTSATDTYHSHRPLLSLTQAPGKPNTHEIHEGWLEMKTFFAFAMPHKCSSGTEDSALPPSTHHASYQFDAEVVYRIFASLTIPVLKKVLSCSIPIKITTPPMPFDIDPQPQDFEQTQRVRTMRLRPERARSKLTFRESFRIFLRPRNLPRLHFTANGMVPGILALGTRPCFALRLQPDNVYFAQHKDLWVPSMTTAPMPKTVDLVQCTFDITALTSGRAFLNRQEIQRRGNTSAYKGTAEANGTSIFCEDNGYTINCQAMQPVTGFVPDFVIYNLKRHYSIRVKWVLECAGKTVIIESESMPLAVFQGPLATARRSTATSGHQIPVPTPGTRPSNRSSLPVLPEEQPTSASPG